MDPILFIAVAAFVGFAFFRSGRSRRSARSPLKKLLRPPRPPRIIPRPPRLVPRPRHTAPRRRVQPNATVTTPRALPDVLTGRAYVIDGDTIVINKVHIRLFGIDAPELNHPWGKKAKWEMVRLCKGQIVTATLDGSSSHDRVVGLCTLPDGTDLSAELVRRGLAIDWPKFSGGKYADCEQPGIRKKLWRCHNRQIGKYVPD